MANPKPTTLSYLRSSALTYFEAAAAHVSLVAYVQNPGDETVATQLLQEFAGLLADRTKLERRVTHYTQKPADRKQMQRLIVAMRAAFKVRRSWIDEEAKWVLYGRPQEERVHTKVQIAAFVRTYLAKPIDKIALDANWFTADDGGLSDDEAPPLVPLPPIVDEVRRKAAINEQTIIMECLPEDILLAAYNQAPAPLRAKLVEYSSALHGRFRSRRDVDQSNVLGVLDQRCREMTKGVLGSDVLQHIAKFACDPRGRPLPLRAPRLLDNEAIAAALMKLIGNMGPLQMTRDATRVCLKRILDAIPDSSVRPSYQVPAPQQQKKKKRRRAPNPVMGPIYPPPGFLGAMNAPAAAAAAAAGGEAAPIEISSEEEDNDSGNESDA